MFQFFLVPTPVATSSLAAPLDAVTLTSSGVAVAPGAATGALASTLADVTLAAAGTATTPAGSTGTFAATLGSVTLAAAGMATPAGMVVGTLAGTLTDVSLTGSGAATTPAGSAAALTATLGTVTLAASGTAAAAGSIVGSLAVSLDAVTLTGSGAAAVPGAAAGTLGLTLGAVTLAAAGSHAGPGTATAALAITLADVTLAAASVTPTGMLAATLADVVLVATAEFAYPAEPVTIVDETDILDDVHARLVRTAEFTGGVHRDTPQGLAPGQIQGSPSVIVRDIMVSDVRDLDPEYDLIQCKTSLIITVRSGQFDDPKVLNARLNRLVGRVRNTLDNESLGPGMTLPGLTTIRRSRETKLQKHGTDWQMELFLDFAYLNLKDS